MIVHVEMASAYTISKFCVGYRTKYRLFRWIFEISNFRYIVWNTFWPPPGGTLVVLMLMLNEKKTTYDLCRLSMSYTYRFFFFLSISYPSIVYIISNSFLA